jgi:adenylate kinase family enzyme
MNLVIHVVGPKKSPYGLLGQSIHELFGPGYHLIDTGELIADKAARNADFASYVKPILESGDLVPGDTIEALLSEKLDSRKAEGAVIIGLLRARWRIEIAQRLGLLGPNSLTILATCKKRVSLNRVNNKVGRRLVHTFFRRSSAEQKKVAQHLRDIGARCHVIPLGHDRSTGFPVAIERVQEFRREQAEGSAWKDPKLAKAPIGHVRDWQSLAAGCGTRIHRYGTLPVSSQ